MDFVYEAILENAQKHRYPHSSAFTTVKYLYRYPTIALHNKFYEPLKPVWQKSGPTIFLPIVRYVY